jgi:DNA primase
VEVDLEQQHVLAPSDRAAVAAHYERAAPLIVANFPLAPVTPVAYPKGLDQDAHYDAPVHYPVPPHVTTIKLSEAHEHRRYPALDEHAIRWYTEERDVVDFCSWTPCASDPERLGYARIILAPRGGATHEQVALAMVAVHRVLGDSGIDAIPVLDGFAGGALFIPFNDTPDYTAVRAWLHEVAETAISRNEDLLTSDQNDQKTQRVHVNVGTNAVGRYSSLPYALTGGPHLGMVTPIEWGELNSVVNGHYTAANSAERLALGDVFGNAAACLVDQCFGGPR